MASLRRDTPAGRAALARRRQRAAAVVEHSARFVNPEDEGVIGASGSSNNLQGPLPTQSQEPTYVDSSQVGSVYNTVGQKEEQAQHQVQPEKQLHSTAKTASTWAAQSVDLQSPDKLLERSAQVAQTAASVLASVRKSRQPQTSHLSDAATRIQFHDAEEPDGAFSSQTQESFYEMPAVSFHGYDHQSQVTDAATISDTQGTSEGIAKRHNQIGGPRQLQVEATSAPNSSHGNRGVGHHRMGVGGDEMVERNDPQEYLRQHQRSGQREFSGHPVPMDTNPLTLEEDHTAQEVGPRMLRQNEVVIRDSSSLVSGAFIFLRSVATSATVTVETSNFGDSVALVGGAGLNATKEVFRVVKLPTTQSSAPDETVLRWGDTISLVSPHLVDPANDKPKALGIRRPSRSQPGGSPVGYQIGVFRSTRGPAETWMLLRGPGRSRHSIRIGLVALRSAKALGQEIVHRGEVTGQVQSGDPILLRNNETGGLLSVNLTNGSLELILDAAQGLSTTMDSLGQLQRNNIYLPTDRDTFVLLKSSVPPCPRWVLGGGTSTSCNTAFNPLGHRMYLHQTYTAEPGRGNISLSLQEALFGYHWPNDSGLDAPNESFGAMKLANQESLLLDEVIGACLGMEGKFIRVKVMGQDHVGQMTRSRPCQHEFDFTGEAELLFDSGLRNLANEILPLAASYLFISEFLASHLPGYEFGSVMQAFCEALGAILKEYTDFVGKMEQQFRQSQPAERALTLQRLYAHLMPSLDSMALLKRVTLAVRGKGGGALLNCLAAIKSVSCEGDLVANKILSFLLERSSIPYMAMLTTWLQSGLLRDPYNEFMIELRHQSVAGSSATPKHMVEPDFGEESFVLNEEHVLTELISSDVLLQKVAATGKYRRAVRVCQTSLRKTVARNEEEHDVGNRSKFLLRYGLDFNSLSSFIQSMYEGASRALVSMLLKDFNLLDALRSMKQYFLLDHGDFLENFLDSAEDELVKDLGDISSGRIQHWLRMAVQLTKVDTPAKSARHSPNVPRLSPLALRCRFVPISLIQHVDSINISGEGDSAKRNRESARDDSLLGTPLRDACGISNKGLTGVETFMLEYPSVPFPISLVLRESALDSYQLLFRLLFFAKYAERRLVGIWQDHQAMKELNSVRGLFGATFLLRQRMLHFAQNLIYYFVFEVIEPNWLEMEEAIGSPSEAYRRTVDDLVDIHSAFLRRTLEACLLTNKELVKTLTKLMTTCLMFADQMKLFTEATRIYDESSHIAAERREAIQRSLNDRGSGGAKLPVDKMALREAIHSFKQDRQIRLKKQKRRVGRELASESYRRMVGRFEEVFSTYLSEFMTQLNGDVGTSNYTHKTNLCSRLDYNGFLFSSAQTLVG